MERQTYRDSKSEALERVGSNPTSPTCSCGKPIAFAGKCKTCYHREYSNKRRQRMIDYLGGHCVICGTTENLEFDHVDRDKKSFNIQKNMTLSNPDVRAELDKCQLLCNEHHREKTARENSGFKHGTDYAWMKKHCSCAMCLEAKDKWNESRNAKRRKSGGRVKGPYNRPTTHGENLHYGRGCRCALCKKAHAEAQREWANGR